MMLNKKGQGMSTSTIILLILGLLVLGILAFGFMSGWSAFQEKMGKTNVGEVAESCSTTCSIGDKFAFCNVAQNIRFQEEKLEYKTSCGVLATVPEFGLFEVADCPRIECSIPCESIKINDLSGKLAAEKDLNLEIDVSSYANDLTEEDPFCVILRK